MEWNVVSMINHAHNISKWLETCSKWSIYSRISQMTNHFAFLDLNWHQAYWFYGYAHTSKLLNWPSSLVTNFTAYTWPNGRILAEWHRQRINNGPKEIKSEIKGKKQHSAQPFKLHLMLSKGLFIHFKFDLWKLYTNWKWIENDWKFVKTGMGTLFANKFNVWLWDVISENPLHILCILLCALYTIRYFKSRKHEQMRFEI